MVEPIIVVAGLGRCGTSLVMQMLSAGGLPTVGTYPDFEDMAVDRHRRSDPAAWADQCAGRAVKVLDPQRVPPPIGYAYRTIWLTRDPVAQGESQIKLIEAAPTRQMRRAMAQSIRRDEPRGYRALRATGSDILHLTFEQLLADPRAAACELIDHVGRERFDVAAAGRMASVAVRRAPGCLPGMLEDYLIAGAA